jgi:hypothetical protein
VKVFSRGRGRKRHREKPFGARSLIPENLLPGNEKLASKKKEQGGEALL